MKMISNLVAAFTLIGLPAISANAFTLFYNSGLHLTTAGWQTSTVTFDIDTSCANYTAEVNAVIQPAIDLWNHVPSSSLTVALGTTVTLSQAITTYIGSSATSYAPIANPIIYCDTNFSADSGEDANSIPGFASSQNMTSTGKLQGGLLVLNFQSGASANLQTLSKTESEIVLAHEMGHVLGLGHSSDTNALMYYQTNPNRNLVLAQDDINAITYLYPRSEPGKGGFLGCGTIAIGGGGVWGKKSAWSSSPGADQNNRDGLAEFVLLLAFLFGATKVLKTGRRDARIP